jgi:hypothetical protein
MGAIDLPKSPNVFHPEKPSAVGSRNSLAQEGRDQQKEVNQLLEEETNKVIHHLTSRLPKEVLERLDVMGGIKEKLYNYYNHNYQNMFNRYITSTEDEMTKKVRNFIDREEMKVLARYTPKEIAELLDQVGGADKFNTGEIEKSIINMYGHLQGHVQRGVNDLENLTNSLLRQKTDVGAFIRGENAYSVVKCAFKDNISKPKTVCDVKLSVNILDSELISPIFHYQVTIEYLIKDLISKHIIDTIDREIERYKDLLLDEGKEEMSDGEIIFKKLNMVENLTDDKTDDPKSRRYTYMAKSLLDRLSDIRAEIDPASFDQLNIRENLKKLMDIENIRNRGFNTAVNSITSILDTSKMGYQYIENLKNARELQIREYEDTNYDILPDERYQIRMRYYDNAQLNMDRAAYDVQLKEFQKEVWHLYDCLQLTYDRSKFLKRISDFDDLAKIYKRRIARKKSKNPDDPLYEDLEKAWDEVSFVKAAETEVEKMNRTYLYEKDKMKKIIILMRDKMKSMYSYQYPIERRVMEDRLAFIEREFTKFDYMINPYHIQPGLLLDVDITSIKRKKATLDGMANVLNEFLHGVSKGFQDAAFASFSRRRSTLRADIAQSFAAVPLEEGQEAAQAAYMSDIGAPALEQTLSTQPPAVTVRQAPKAKAKAKAKAAPSRTVARKKGVVDTGRRSKPASKSRGRDSGLREI